MAWLPGQRAQRQLRDALHQVTRYRITLRLRHPRRRRGPPRRAEQPDPHRQGRQERTGYAVDSQRTRAVRELAERAEHRLFLSATPHNGYTESFTALLEMIDPQRFVRGNKIDRPKRSRRSRSAGSSGPREAKGSSSCTGRGSSPTPRQPDEAEAYERLLAFTKRRDKAVAAGGGSTAARDMATLLLKKRFFSSPVAFARTVDVYRTPASAGSTSTSTLDYDEILRPRRRRARGRQGRPARACRPSRRPRAPCPPLTEEDQEDLDWLSDWGHRYEGRPGLPA